MKKMKEYLNEQFVTTFQKEPEKYFSCGGRFEVLGNHTDHNHGLCIAATCDLEIGAAVIKREDKTIRLLSEGFGYFEMDISSLEMIEDEMGKPAALVRGILNYLSNEFKVGGFDIYVKCEIPAGTGVSSSAAFEMLIATIIDNLFNNSEIPMMTMCKAGQFAERNYYGKKCGLLDQIGVSAGGLVFIDFADISNPFVDTLHPNLEGYQFMILNTGGSHAELSAMYDAIPQDMYAVSDYFKKAFLRDVNYEELFHNKMDIIEKCGELAYNRAEHFFKENERVQKAIEAINANDIKTLIKLMNESRESSTKLLQNMYVDKKKDSPLEACELIMKVSGKKAGVKINGGGFAGSVIALIPEDVLDAVVKAAKEKYGKENIYLVNVRDEKPSEII